MSWFPSQRSAGFGGREEERSGGILGGKWPQHASTTLFFLISKNITSERPICAHARDDSLVRSFQEPEAATWQYKYRIEWDATDVRNGGAQRTVLEMLLEVEKLRYHAGSSLCFTAIEFRCNFASMEPCKFGESCWGPLCCYGHPGHIARVQRMARLWHFLQDGRVEAGTRR